MSASPTDNIISKLRMNSKISGICQTVLEPLMENTFPFSVLHTVAPNTITIKKNYSVVLLATCDARYTFTMVDIGAYGSQSYGGILSQSKFGKKLSPGQLPLPDVTELANSELKFPYYFVEEPAFPVFNYRLSQGRFTIENAFGILVARWTILRTTLNCLPDNAEKIGLATVALHNFLMLNKLSASKYCPSFYVDDEDSAGNTIIGQWRNEVDSTTFSGENLRLESNNTTKHIFKMRDKLKEYFNNQGAILLQNKVK